MKHTIYWIRCSIIAFTIASCSSNEDVVKEDPVIPEVVNQAAFRIAGNDVSICMAVEAGQLELNAFEPLMSSM